jgi:formylglycine-generating enzyme required for sulfatase activity
MRSAAAERVRGWLRRLDRLRAGPGLALGAGVGLGAGYLLVGPGHWAGLAGGVALLGGAAALAWSGEPVAEAVKELVEPLEMVEIRGGTFWMGSPEEEGGRFPNEGPRHKVRVDAFAIGRFPVTQGLYTKIMGENPGDPQGDDLPVNNVSWEMAVRFCNRLSEEVGLTPCYAIAESGEVTWDRGADGYRLPTEAEWEYAARAGTQTAYYFGDDPAGLNEHAWWEGNANNIQPVGQKKPNAWELHDMLGNVWEWCWDWYGPYAGEESDNPVGALSGERRVVRGGSFLNVPWGLRSADRGGDGPEDRLGINGFRCVRASGRQP